MRRYLLPFLIVFVYQWKVAANVPWSDEWLMLPWLDRQFETGGIHGLFDAYNGHHPVVARLLLLGSAYFDGLDFRHLKFLGGFALLAAVWVLFRMIGAERGWRALIPCGLTLFSLRQWENLDWGMQSSVFIMLLCSVAAIASLHEGKIARTLFAAAIAPLAWAGGTMLWLALAVQAALSRPRSRLPWVFAGGAVFFLGWNESAAKLWFNVPGAGLYVLRNLAGALIYEEAPGFLHIVVGGAVAGAYGLGILMFHRAPAEERRAASPFLSLVILSLLNTFSFVVGRYAIGYDQPGASRYATVTALGVAGAMMLLTICRGPLPARIMLTVMMIAGPLYADFVMFRMSPWVRLYGANLVRIVKLPSRTPDDLKPFQLFFDSIEPGIEILRRRGWSTMNCGCR